MNLTFQNFSMLFFFFVLVYWAAGLQNLTFPVRKRKVRGDVIRSVVTQKTD